MLLKSCCHILRNREFRSGGRLFGGRHGSYPGSRARCSTGWGACGDWIKPRALRSEGLLWTDWYSSDSPIGCLNSYRLTCLFINRIRDVLLCFLVEGILNPTIQAFLVWLLDTLEN